MKPKTDNRKLTTENLPKHVAFIMDGNRRWAKEKGRPWYEGHQIGEQRIEPLVDRAIELKIPYVTFWAFATANWNRKPEEIDYLLRLFRENLNKRVDQFHKKNVRVHVIGNLRMFPKDIQEMTAEWIEKTKENKKITVNIALSYGGRDELIRAFQKIVTEKISVKNITEEIITSHLDTAGQPNPDIMIRTGGEQRLSGFLLWQLEYAELYFTDTYWPDFTPEEFEKALLEYQHRQRRFGK